MKEITQKTFSENSLTVDRILELAEARALCKWAADNLINGAALHIIIEDGNYQDSCVQFCKEFLESGEWEKACREGEYGYTQEDNERMLRLCVLFEGMTEQEREMIDNNSVITDELFSQIFNVKP